MTTRTATCSCGQLTAIASGDPVRISICHCLACQRRTGSVFAAQARFPSDSVSITGDSNKFLRTGDEGSRTAFHFCPACGATVYFITEGNEQQIAIAVGAFADPNFPAPWISVYEGRKHAWVEVPADIEHYA